MKGKEWSCPCLPSIPFLLFPVAEPWSTCANLSFGAGVHGGGQVGVHARGEGWEELQELLGAASSASPSCLLTCKLLGRHWGSEHARGAFGWPQALIS